MRVQGAMMNIAAALMGATPDNAAAASMTELVVSDLAATYDMALPSFMEHLKVLERSGLVRSHKAGRVRTYELVPKQLGMAENWLVRQRGLWERRLDQLDSYLMKMKQEKEK